MGGRARYATEEKRKGENRRIRYSVCILRENRPTLLSRAKWDEERTNNPVIRHNSFPRYSLVSGANTPHTTKPSPLGYSRTSLFSIPSLLSNLPAARYRLPNKLTGAEHSVTSGIPVLVSFQNRFQPSNAILRLALPLHDTLRIKFFARNYNTVTWTNAFRLHSSGWSVLEKRGRWFPTSRLRIFLHS